MKKKTHEEYVVEVAKANPNIEVIGTYINIKTKILHRCKIDGYEWYATPGHILHNRGCPICGRKSSATTRSKTHSEYVKQVFQLNPNIEVIGIYVNSNTKILHRCRVDGYEWYTTPATILSGKGCPECGARNSRAMTTEEYRGKLSNLNPDIEIIGDFLGLQNKILHRCKIDNYAWIATPISMLNNAVCPLCYEKETTDSFKKELHNINPNIEVLGKYRGVNVKILCRCKIDGYIWEPTPANLLRGCGCPKCAGLNRKTTQEYIDEVSNINSNIEALGDYVNAKTQILHRCKACGTKWFADPHHILRGSGCPVCNESHGERIIRQYLNDKNVDFISQYTFDDCRYKKLLPFDFYLIDKNICIEFDGIQHFEPVDIFGGTNALQEVRRNDSIKTNYCANKNIQLLRIRYDDNITEKLDEFLKDL